MSDLNVCCLSGRATVTPELKQSSGGNEYCFLKIAINEFDFKTKKPVVNFVTIMVGGKLAAIVADRVDKGAQVTVQAKVRIRKGDKAKGTFDSISLHADAVVFSAPPKQDRHEEDEQGDEPI